MVLSATKKSNKYKRDPSNRLDLSVTQRHDQCCFCPMAKLEFDILGSFSRALYSWLPIIFSTTFPKKDIWKLDENVQDRELNIFHEHSVISQNQLLTWPHEGIYF